MGSLINSTFSGINNIMIYHFIFELEEIKIKLSSEQYNEYVIAIRKNKKRWQFIIILMIILEGIIMVLKTLELFIEVYGNNVLSNILEIVFKIFLMLIVFYMINMFVRLAYFFKDKKEEKMSKF